MNASYGTQPLIRVNYQLSFLVLKSSPYYSISLKQSKEMASLKFTLNFTISQTPLKCQDSCGERTPHQNPSSGWEAVKDGTVPPDALLANGLQCNSKYFSVFLRTASLLATARQVDFRITSLGGLGQLEQEESGKTAGSAKMSDRHFPSLIQSATSRCLGNMQGNCSCLRARLLYSEREKFAWSFVCQGIRQSHC